MLNLFKVVALMLTPCSENTQWSLQEWQGRLLLCCFVQEAVSSYFRVVYCLCKTCNAFMINRNNWKHTVENMSNLEMASIQILQNNPTE